MAGTQDSIVAQWVEFTNGRDRQRVIELVKRYTDEWGGTRELKIAVSLEEARYLAETLPHLIATARKAP